MNGNAGPDMDEDSPAAMLACQSVLRLLHGRLKAFPEGSEASTETALAPHRRAAARSIRTRELHILEQVLALHSLQG